MQNSFLMNKLIFKYLINFLELVYLALFCSLFSALLISIYILKYIYSEDDIYEENFIVCIKLFVFNAIS